MRALGTRWVVPIPHGSLAQPGVLAFPQASGASSSSVREAGRGQGHCYEPGGKGAMYPRQRNPLEVPSCVAVQVHGKPRHHREAAALYGAARRACVGPMATQPRGVKAKRARGTRGWSPRCGQASPGASATACRGHAAPGRASSQGQCGQQQAARAEEMGLGGSSREPQGSSPGDGDSQRRCWQRAQLLVLWFQRGCRGLSGGCRQPALAPPMRLPEGSVQLLQLGAQRKVDLQMHMEGFQPLLQLAERWPEQEEATHHSCAIRVCFPPSTSPRGPPGEVLKDSPLLRVQVAAADSDGEETGGTSWGTVAVQEAPDIEAKVSGAGQVVRVSAHPANDLGKRSWLSHKEGTPTPRREGPQT